LGTDMGSQCLSEVGAGKIKVSTALAMTPTQVEALRR
jgi:hypothetical protein